MARFAILIPGLLLFGLFDASAPPPSDRASVASHAPNSWWPAKLEVEMTTPRSGHSATLLPDGRVLVVGGMIRDGALLASAEIFDPRTRRFTAIAAMPNPRLGHTATLLANGKVLVAGGLGGEGGRQSVAQATALLFDPATESWQPTGGMSEARSEATATLLEDGRVLVAGGERQEVAVASAEVYDPGTGRFSPTGSMGTARSCHAAAPLPGDRVLVAGGCPDLHQVVASAEIYDARSGRFAPTGAMTIARRKMAATPLPDGRVLITGGTDLGDWRNRFQSAETYDPKRGTFLATGSMATGRFKHSGAVVALADGRVLVIGGSNRVERYDPATGTFGTLDALSLPARFYSTATLLKDGKVLVVGGYDERVQEDRAAWILVPSHADAAVSTGRG